jgi:hypothetical protein
MIPEIEPAHTTPFAMLTAPKTHALTITSHTMGGKFCVALAAVILSFGILKWPSSAV